MRAVPTISDRFAASDSTTERQLKCPTCRGSSRWVGNPHRPFCSLTCRLVDLGVWLDERYRIDADAPPDVP